MDELGRVSLRDPRSINIMMLPKKKAATGSLVGVRSSLLPTVTGTAQLSRYRSLPLRLRRAGGPAGQEGSVASSLTRAALRVAGRVPVRGILNAMYS
jgi:hypothetical protein